MKHFDITAKVIIIALMIYTIININEMSHNINEIPHKIEMNRRLIEKNRQSIEKNSQYIKKDSIIKLNQSKTN